MVVVVGELYFHDSFLLAFAHKDLPVMSRRCLILFPSIRIEPSDLLLEASVSYEFKDVASPEDLPVHGSFDGKVRLQRPDDLPIHAREQSSSPVLAYAHQLAQILALKQLGVRSSEAHPPDFERKRVHRASKPKF